MARILVIDDETEFRETIAQALTLDGYDVETALDGSEGAMAVCRHPYDLIFCDHAGDGWGGSTRRSSCCVPRVLKRLVFVTARRAPRTTGRPGCRSCRSRSRFTSSGPSWPGWSGRRF